MVLHTLLARLGPHVPIPERDVRSLAGTVAAGTAATRRVISFLHAHALLEADELSENPGSCSPTSNTKYSRTYRT
ncbi:hypothetical protein ADL01_12180 [Streptomyces sp. NRRL WC-3618]|uniref:hypothetical protein n=1 Tax=Streptomyces sp. NRRL WC-3618 TaxID=1519490 RepID=UPI0006ADA1FD|nr:hypothetical protein [Streptomyces sp. NRRL WC-3618]KOV80456.1 hypothetical protein ADL01_12180 [Streptomyces sp. NRRL WC-3618]